MLPAPVPDRRAIEGRYLRLEPMSAAHVADLYQCATGANAEGLHRYLFEVPPGSEAELGAWVAARADAKDPLFFACRDLGSGRVTGRQALMRITPENGVIEIGSILWGPAMARTRLATEALYLMAAYVFDELGYRRFEWKCNALNEPSRRAALRFGFQFEGVFRQHMWVKGGNRDTAWFAMTDGDWPALRAGYVRWLQRANFDEAGRQRTTLGACVESG